MGLADPCVSLLIGFLSAAAFNYAAAFLSSAAFLSALAFLAAAALSTRRRLDVAGCAKVNTCVGQAKHPGPRRPRVRTRTSDPWAAAARTAEEPEPAARHRGGHVRSDQGDVDRSPIRFLHHVAIGHPPVPLRDHDEVQASH